MCGVAGLITKDKIFLHLIIKEKMKNLMFSEDPISKVLLMKFYQIGN